MKIYPGTHKIISTKKANNEDIKLGVFENIDAYSYDVDTVFNIETKNSNIPLIPFQKTNGYVFNKNEEKIDIEMKNGNLYYPQDSFSFTPEKYNFELLIKKIPIFNHKKKYNIKAGVINLDFAQKIIPVLGDAPLRNLCPDNISFNNNSTSIVSLLSNNVNDLDFLFLESTDGVKHKDGTTDIDFSSYKNTNTFIFCDTHDLLKNDPIANINIETPLVLYSKEMDFDYYFDLEDLDIDNTKFKIYNPFDNLKTPFYILEDLVNHSFRIYSSKSFLNNIQSDLGLFYEIILEIYMASYKTIISEDLYICDEDIDYKVVNNLLVSYVNYINLNMYIKYDNYTIVYIKTNNENVILDNRNNNSISFKKVTNNDPIKENNIFVLTTNNKIISMKEMVYSIDKNISNYFSYDIKDSTVTISINKGFISSSNKIYVTEKIDLPFSLFEYDINNQKVFALDVTSILYYDYSRDEFKLINSTFFYDNENYLKIATISFKKKQIVKLFDIRKQGGTSRDYETNYDLLDKGDLAGRPFRKSGTIIVEIPMIYKNKINEIEYAISKKYDPSTIVIVKIKE